jgi:Uma2 family endonuclease
MASAPQRWITEEEYLAAERAAVRKSEYFDGRLFAMAGATESHNLIVGNLIQRMLSSFAVHPNSVMIVSIHC